MTRRRRIPAPSDGWLNALPRCLRSGLAKLYPVLKGGRFEDYKVRLVAARNGTASKVRVLIRCSDEGGTWVRVGVSENVVEASWRALLDAARPERIPQRRRTRPRMPPALEIHRGERHQD